MRDKSKTKQKTMDYNFMLKKWDVHWTRPGSNADGMQYSTL